MKSIAVYNNAGKVESDQNGNTSVLCEISKIFVIADHQLVLEKITLYTLVEQITLYTLPYVQKTTKGKKCHNNMDSPETVIIIWIAQKHFRFAIFIMPFNQISFAWKFLFGLKHNHQTANLSK